MAWIESHQALGHHPKTLRLATGLKCSVPTAVGYLHLLWWWALDYAPDGSVPATAKPIVAQQCYWRGKPDVFWAELRAAGFVEDADDGVLKIHDWMDYAGRLVEKRAANVMRTQRARDAQRSRNVRVRYAATNQPTGEGVKPSPSPTNPSPLPDESDATADGAPPRRGSPRENGTNPRALGTNPRAEGTNPRAIGMNPRAAESAVEVIHANAGICPLCRLAYTGPYLEHTAEQHRVHREPGPGNLGKHFARRPKTDEPPPEVAAEFAAMHQRLQSLTEAPG